MVFLLMAVACWSALGCDALREFSYSRLEELCVKRGVADRFGQILKMQGQALLALEFLLTLATQPALDYGRGFGEKNLYITSHPDLRGA